MPHTDLEQHTAPRLHLHYVRQRLSATYSMQAGVPDSNMSCLRVAVQRSLWWLESLAPSCPWQTASASSRQSTMRSWMRQPTVSRQQVQACPQGPETCPELPKLIVPILLQVMHLCLAGILACLGGVSSQIILPCMLARILGRPIRRTGIKAGLHAWQTCSTDPQGATHSVYCQLSCCARGRSRH